MSCDALCRPMILMGNIMAKCTSTSQALILHSQLSKNHEQWCSYMFGWDHCCKDLVMELYTCFEQLAVIYQSTQPSSVSGGAQTSHQPGWLDHMWCSCLVFTAIHPHESTTIRLHHSSNLTHTLHILLSCTCKAGQNPGQSPSGLQTAPSASHAAHRAHPGDVHMTLTCGCKRATKDLVALTCLTMHA